MSVPLKLGSLIARTLSKPIANSIKAQAKDHRVFRDTCVHVAQTMHRVDYRLRLGLLGQSTDKQGRVRPLSEAKAIETGANFISETFLFSVAGSLILFESWRSRRKAQTRRDNVDDQLKVLQEEVELLKSQNALLKEFREKKQQQQRGGILPPPTTTLALPAQAAAAPASHEA